MWMYGDVFGMDLTHEKDPCRHVKKRMMEMEKPWIA
jgi:hypothetical protein